MDAVEWRNTPRALFNMPRVRTLRLEEINDVHTVVRGNAEGDPESLELQGIIIVTKTTAIYPLGEHLMSEDLLVMSMVLHAAIGLDAAFGNVQDPEAAAFMQAVVPGLMTVLGGLLGAVAMGISEAIAEEEGEGEGGRRGGRSLLQLLTSPGTSESYSDEVVVEHSTPPASGALPRRAIVEEITASDSESSGSGSDSGSGSATGSAAFNSSDEDAGTDSDAESSSAAVSVD